MTRQAGSAGIFAISIALIVYRTDTGSVATLNEFVCDSKIYDLDHYKLWSIEWTGQKLPKNCRIGVRAEVVSVTMCFNIEVYRLGSCGFFLVIYTWYSNTPEKIYSCNELRSKVKFCHYNSKLLYLNFTSNYTRSVSFSPKVRITVLVEGGDTTGRIPDEPSSGSAIGFIFGGLFFVVIACMARKCCSSVCDILRGICDCISRSLDCLSCDEEEETQPRRQYTEIEIARDPPGVYTVANQSRAVSLGSLESLEESRSMLSDNELDPPAYHECISSISVPLSTVDNERDSNDAPPTYAASASSLSDESSPTFYDCQMTWEHETSV
ncbi:uncharacterized protein LOC117330924 [Pecten maximus]|uniref:uncharacterized protein LOC117330924 n=1 Tax=Pecten maximus TaxID=6579 RepID=UPI001458E4BB|nr:uncharacterized protein LOC117330924 [Pecten maximus]XP_033745378.1 uncharacterized protein LOC117330924 [Pecten maximus]XP_033745379.1 uncharacterized protein LOC117330924 [Pecten maximus]